MTLHHGDCLDVMAGLEAESVDAVVTDPPYGLEFMGKDWDAPWRPTGDVLTDPASVGGFQDGHGGNPFSRSRIRYGREGGAMIGYQQWCEQWATECLRILKPGGHLLAFGGSRTWHRLAAAIEDAGFEIRDSIAWIYGSGFPKSLDVSKAIDKTRSEDRAPIDAVRAWLNEKRLAAGYSHDAVNKHFGHASNGGGSSSGWMTNPTSKSLPAWEQWLELKSLFGFGDDMDAEVWRLNGRKGNPGDNYASREVLATREVVDIRNGHGREYGSALYAGVATGKIEHHITAPATEAAKQWQGYGTSLKPAFEPVVVARKPLSGTVAANVLAYGTGALNIDGCRVEAHDSQLAEKYASVQTAGARANSVYGRDVRDRAGSAPHTAGRWPANVVLDDAAAAELDRQSGVSVSPPVGSVARTRGSNTIGTFAHTGRAPSPNGHGDAGGASRFFPTFRYTAKAATAERPTAGGVAHPTVKPLDLMRWLVRLVTPPGGTVLEPFAGSGTTVEACLREGKRCIAIERESSYLALILNRLDRAQMGFDFE